MIKLKPLIASIVLPVGLGITAGYLTKNAPMVYQSLVLPPFSPPTIVFPIVWTILFILMGISSYLIYISNDSNKYTALNTYIIQLIVNFSWSLTFFLAGCYSFSFILLVILWVLIVKMIVSFYKINPIAAYLQIPYLLWVTFAGYLNLAIAILN